MYGVHVHFNLCLFHHAEFSLEGYSSSTPIAKITGHQVAIDFKPIITHNHLYIIIIIMVNMQKLNIKCKPVKNGGPKSPTKNVRIISTVILL